MVSIGKSNRFYIIVHADEAEKDLILRNEPKFRKTLDEINHIKLNYDYKIIPGSMPPNTLFVGLPKNKPIYVCGFFKDIGVKEQYDTLEQYGYNARISDYGSYEIKNYPLNQNSYLNNRFEFNF